MKFPWEFPGLRYLGLMFYGSSSSWGFRAKHFSMISMMDVLGDAGRLVSPRREMRVDNTLTSLLIIYHSFFLHP